MTLDRPIRVVVDSVTWETADINSYVLVAAENEGLPPYEPGAHIDVLINNELIRQYSLYGSPSDTSCYAIAVKLDPSSRGGSKSLHQDVKAGTVLLIGRPRNQFRLSPEAQFHLLVAGGIG